MAQPRQQRLQVYNRRWEIDTTYKKAALALKNNYQEVKLQNIVESRGHNQAKYLVLTKNQNQVPLWRDFAQRSTSQQKTPTLSPVHEHLVRGMHLLRWIFYCLLRGGCFARVTFSERHETQRLVAGAIVLNPELFQSFPELTLELENISCCSRLDLENSG